MEAEVEDKILLRTVLYLYHRLERAVRKGDLPLTLSQYRLLFMIQEGPARSVELAAASGLTKPSVGTQLALMEEQGWIRRVEMARDRRAASIRITRAGRKVLADFETELNRSLQDFLGEDAVARSNSELRWLFERWTQRREQAHDQWALRKTGGEDEGAGQQR